MARARCRVPNSMITPIPKKAGRAEAGAYQTQLSKVALTGKPNTQAIGEARNATDKQISVIAMVKYRITSGIISRMYSTLDQLRGSVNISLIRVSRGLSRSE